MTLSYEKIFSRVRGSINDPKELSLNEADLSELYTERLHNVAGEPCFRKKFSSIELDDVTHDVRFELRNPVDDESDLDFVVRVFVLGMSIEWLRPQVDSVLHTSVMIGGKEEKKIIDNYKNMIDRLEKMETKFKKIIADYGYLHNDYIENGG